MLMRGNLLKFETWREENNDPSPHKRKKTSFPLHLGIYIFFVFCQVTISLNICATIATAMGPNVNRHLKILGPGIFSTLADAKVRRIQFTQVCVK